jgi:hypothetical protein
MGLSKQKTAIPSMKSPFFDLFVGPPQHHSRAIVQPRIIHYSLSSLLLCRHLRMEC